MSGGIFPFEMGKFECQVIDDGLIKIPNERTIGLKCLLIRTGEYNVLIDTGEGIGTTAISGRLLENLPKAGITTTEIDRVIITHAHRDHIGGCADAKGQPIFPSARYIIHEKEWDYWIPRLNLKPDGGSIKENESERLNIAMGRKNLLPIKQYWDVVRDGDDIVPGIKLVPAPGHTPGNVMVIISSDQKQLFCIGDALHEPAEFITAGLWARGDTNPEEADYTRNRIVSLAAGSNALVFINHFPFPGLGYIVKKGDTFTWQPFTK